MSSKHKQKRPSDKKKDNSVGLTEVRQSRPKALEALAKAKSIEAERIQNGYRWMTNDKKSIFVAPDRIEHYQFKGFRVINPNI